jgi:hypothetical protein
MAVPIIPRIERGRLYFQIADVLFPTYTQTAGARPDSGKPRDGAETCCPAFVAKDGAR